jgi:predicted permease
MAAGQVAIAIVLLAGGTLMLRSFWNLRYRDVGFRADRLLAAHLNLNRARYGDPVRQTAFLNAVEAGIRGLPGVESAALGSVPPGEGHATNGFAIEGQAPVPVTQRPVARLFPVSPEYFRMLGIGLLAGRGLEESDTAASERVAVVGETFARRNFADRNAIGRKIRTGRNAPWHTIVGVVADIKTAGLGTAPEPVVYFPYRQTPFDLNGVGILIRTAANPGSIARAVRQRVAQLDPEQAVTETATMEERLNGSVSRPRLTAVLLGCFAAMGLVLATVGLYGAMSFLVKSRLREMGIRLAVGARPGDLVRLVLGQSLRLILGGAAVGLAVSAWLTRFVENLLYGVSAKDPLAFAGAVGFLVLVGIAAVLAPARQAAGVDPAATLRGE